MGFFYTMIAFFQKGGLFMFPILFVFAIGVNSNTTPRISWQNVGSDGSIEALKIHVKIVLGGKTKSVLREVKIVRV